MSLGEPTLLITIAMRRVEMLLIIDIVFRSMDMPLHGLAELSVFVMMIVIYLGLSRCEEHSEHVGLEFAINKLSSKARRVAVAVAQFLAVATVGLMFYAVTTDAWSAFETNSSIEGLVDLPIWPTKFVMVVGMVFFLLQAIINLVDSILVARGYETTRISD
ncbi:MAG: TRAP transporter small permease [Planctomycetes bacterium]|nr:TRAP transporter small permease [Planctomycetota bacterium]